MDGVSEMHDLTTVIYCDNQSVIALSKNFKSHSKLKYIEMQFHNIQDDIASKEFKLH